MKGLSELVIVKFCGKSWPVPLPASIMLRSAHGQRRSVTILRRIHSRHPFTRRLANSGEKMDFATATDGLSSSPRTCTSAASVNLSFGKENPRGSVHKTQLPGVTANYIPNKQSVQTLVIKNPVLFSKLKEPIERKREYWSDNLLYVMRREGLIPKDRPVVMDQPTPEEPYRLAANVVRLLEQEPHLYIAKSSIKSSDTSTTTISSSTETEKTSPWSSHISSQSSYDTSSSNSVDLTQSRRCKECGRSDDYSNRYAQVFNSSATPFAGTSRVQSSWISPYAQLRNYSTSISCAAVADSNRKRV